MAARLQVSPSEWRGDACVVATVRSVTSALRRRSMVWMAVAGLCFCFRERAVGDRALLNVRLASSGSDANVCASGNRLYRSVWPWFDTRKLLDEFLAAGNTLESDSSPKRRLPHPRHRRTTAFAAFPRQRIPKTTLLARGRLADAAQIRLVRPEADPEARRPEVALQRLLEPLFKRLVREQLVVPFGNFEDEVLVVPA